MFFLKMHQNLFSAGAPPRTPLWDLTTLPRPLVGWGGGKPLPIPLGALAFDAFGVSSRGNPLFIPLPFNAFGVRISAPSPSRLLALDPPPKKINFCQRQCCETTIY